MVISPDALRVRSNQAKAALASVASVAALAGVDVVLATAATTAAIVAPSEVQVAKTPKTAKHHTAVDGEGPCLRDEAGAVLVLVTLGQSEAAVELVLLTTDPDADTRITEWGDAAAEALGVEPHLEEGWVGQGYLMEDGLHLGQAEKVRGAVGWSSAAGTRWDTPALVKTQRERNNPELTWEGGEGLGPVVIMVVAAVG